VIADIKEVHMNKSVTIEAYVHEALQYCTFAVLATEGEGQPHASLVAITPSDDFKELIFATYRSTRKYNNLTKNGKVAVLFENRCANNLTKQDITVLTAFGNAEELNNEAFELAFESHVFKHPEQRTFLSSKDCAIFRVKVAAYQLVFGIDDVNWWKINE